MHAVEIETPFGNVKATWQHIGHMIEVRYGEYMQMAQASDADAANDFVARDILRRGVAEDSKDRGN